MSAPVRRTARPLRPSTAQPSALHPHPPAAASKLARAPSSSALSASSSTTSSGRRIPSSASPAEDENVPVPSTSTGMRRAGKPSLAPPSAAATAARRERQLSTAAAAAAGRERVTSVATRAPDAEVADGLEGAEGKKDGQDGTNIEVVVRCRGRSTKEIAENSPIIVSTAGALGPTLTIETSPITSSSSLALLSAPTSSAGAAPTRTYTFDKVFGPEADQGTVWDEVVKETLDEVMMGYNCTIFAYGQTGTGKTYTMQGDLVPNTLGNPSSEAGIVPRTLHRLFAALDSAPTLLARDSSVKISFIEIYNEDIRDLLSPGYVHPSVGAGQPMAAGARSAAGGAGAGPGQGQKETELKIYEDPNPKGRGVVIQGLEELGVRSARDGIELLRKGSARRETGETLMNATSSRSHSIFSITVHIKETSPTGEDLLKVGKLNLVDLAGSENIGRSGAVDTRAREAGMINQSLLTLGRVINSLVKKSSHIPYRESKLTRLLQDSLGGRTKTRIIATISPSRSNLEETLSTIDYAMRATRIMNRPEVNQKMTKNGLISEYVAEIEGLKKDLLAAREKNGIYITAEDYAQLNEDAKLHATQLDEAKSRHVILNNRLTHLTAELEETAIRLLTTEEARRALKESLDELAEELELEKRAVEEFEKGEERIDGVAQVYRGAFGDATGDLDGLFAKKDRTTAVLTANTASGSSHASSTLGEVSRLNSQLNDFRQAQAAVHERAIAETNEFKKRRLNNHEETLSALASGSTAFATSTAQVDKYLERAHAEYASYRSEVEGSRARIDASLRGQSTGVKEGLVRHEAQLSTAVSERLEETRRIEGALAGFDEHVGKITSLQEPRAVLVDEKDVRMRDAETDDLDRLTAASELITSLVTACEQEYSARRTRLGTSLLGRMAAFQQQQAAQAQAFQDELLALHESEMAGLEQAQTRSLLEIKRAVQGVKEERELKRKEREEEQERLSSQLKTADKQVLAVANKVKTLGQSLQGDLHQAIATTEESVATGLSALTQHAVELIDLESSKIATQLSTLSSATNAAAGVSDKTLKKQRFALKTSRNGVDELLKAFEGDVQGASRDVEKSSDAILSTLSSLDSSLATFSTTHASSLVALRDSTTAFQRTGLRADVPTGTTPRKRQWDHVPATWERTGSLAEVKERLRAAVGVGGGSTMLRTDDGGRSGGE